MTAGVSMVENVWKMVNVPVQSSTVVINVKISSTVTAKTVVPALTLVNVNVKKDTPVKNVRRRIRMTAGVSMVENVWKMVNVPVQSSTVVINVKISSTVNVRMEANVTRAGANVQLGTTAKNVRRNVTVKIRVGAPGRVNADVKQDSLVINVKKIVAARMVGPVSRTAVVVRRGGKGTSVRCLMVYAGVRMVECVMIKGSVSARKGPQGPGARLRSVQLAVRMEGFVNLGASVDVSSPT